MPDRGNGFAASIEAGSSVDRPDLAEDARAIARVAKRMMTTLRETLLRLRSQDLDELGLEACLVQLVAGWNARAEPRALVHLDLMETSPACRERLRRAFIASRRNA